jgi:hypothetical protein
MNLINYKEIDFKKSINKENKIINFNDSEIQIVPYLSINDKYDLVMTTLRKSYENGIYNPIKIQIYFNLNIIYLYTNIMFDSEDRANAEDIYNNFKDSGLLDLIKENISEKEKDELKSLLCDTLKVLKEYELSIAGFLSSVIGELTDKIQDGLKTIKDINPELLNGILGKFPQLQDLLPNENGEN